MASERFLNLPEEKKQRIIAAARDELSRVPYDALSINRIIKEAVEPLIRLRKAIAAVVIFNPLIASFSRSKST